MTLLKSIKLDIAKKLEDKEYRTVFFEEWARDEVADQIRRLRKLRGLRQIDVAKATGMKQSVVSRIEQSEHSRWNFATLMRLAEALDARVHVTFETAEEVIEKYESEQRKMLPGSSATALRMAELENEQAFKNHYKMSKSPLSTPLTNEAPQILPLERLSYIRQDLEQRQ